MGMFSFVRALLRVSCIAEQGPQWPGTDGAQRSLLRTISEHSIVTRDWGICLEEVRAAQLPLC